MTEPHDIVPEDVDAETLSKRVYGGSHPRTDPILRCDHCGYASLQSRIGSSAKRYCHRCELYTNGVVAASKEQAKQLGDAE